MSIYQNNIKPAFGSTKNRKRVGRGNASGHGTYSCRGLKGQKSRSGGKKGLAMLSMKKFLQHIPKKGGFKSDKLKNQVVNLSSINNKFKNGDKINPVNLLQVGLINTIKAPVKILGKGELKLKDLIFSDVLISESVRKQVEKMDGKLAD